MCPSIETFMSRLADMTLTQQSVFRDIQFLSHNLHYQFVIQLPQAVALMRSDIVYDNTQL